LTRFLDANRAPLRLENALTPALHGFAEQLELPMPMPIVEKQEAAN
jgi:hypothetical protein